MRYQKLNKSFLILTISHRFINSVINNFQEKSDETDNYIIPPYRPYNKEFSKRFMKKFDVFTDNKYDIRIK